MTDLWARRRRLLERATRAGVLARLHRRFRDRDRVDATPEQIEEQWRWLKAAVRDAERNLQGDLSGSSAARVYRA
jgi:hypothetical protein